MNGMEKHDVKVIKNKQKESQKTNQLALMNALSHCLSLLIDKLSSKSYYSWSRNTGVHFFYYLEIVLISF